MRRILTAALVLFSVVCSILAVPSMVSAYDPLGAACNGTGSSVCGGGGADPIAGPNGAIVSVTSILALVAGIVSIIFLIIGGLKYITSGGDSSGVSTAKNTIIGALIGLLIAALARPIITFVISKL